jgi:hypothetical protein
MARSTEKSVQKIPLGTSIVQDGNGLILHRRQANGEISAIHLTEEEFWELRGAVVFWERRILSQRQAPSSELETILVQSVAQAGVLSDMMRESVLMVVTTPTGEQMTLELPPHVAKFIADQVPNVLSEMTTGTWH